MLIEDFNHTIDIWIDAIQQYTFRQICTKPNAVNWSIGQVCMHLVNDTNWFIEQIKISLSNNDNADQTISPFAMLMFENNSFPDEKLTNPANINIPQPTSKEALFQLFILLKKNMNDTVMKMEKTKYEGKTRHPGFGYFNAEEWLQFAEMHLRHHLKQKKRIEDSLRYKNA